MYSPCLWGLSQENRVEFLCISKLFVPLQHQSRRCVVKRPRRGWFSMVVVAQLVEPRIVVPVVVGSSPIVHPIREEERVGIGRNILIPALAVLR